MSNGLEVFLNIFGSMFVGTLCIEYGASKLQKRGFTKKNLWPIFLIVFAVRGILKNIF